MFRNNQTCVHLSRHPSSVLRGVRAHSSSFQLQRHPSRVLSSFAPIRVAFIFRTHPSRILCADPSHFHLSRPSESLSSLPYLSRVIRANPSRFHISRPSDFLYLSRPFESRPSRPSGSLSNGSGKTKDSLIRPLFEGPSGLSIETMSARSRVQPRHVPPMAR